MYKKLEDFQNSALWRGVYGVNGLIISLTGVALTLVIFATVIARYIFKTDLFGSEEVILLLAWWMYFIGGIGGSQEDSQIKADMIEVFCSNKFVVDLAKGIAKALESLVMFLCGYMSILMLQTNFIKMPVTTGLKIPFVASQIPIAIGFFGMGIFAVYWALYYCSKALYEKNGGTEDK